MIVLKAWLLAPIDRMPKAGLCGLIDQLPGDLRPYPPGALTTCDAMRAFLTLARGYYWQDKALKREIARLSAPTSGSTVRRPGCVPASLASLCEVPASEVNEFLRQLPAFGDCPDG